MTGYRLISCVIVVLASAILVACSTTATQTPVADPSAERAANIAYFAQDFSCTRVGAEEIGLKLLNVMPDRYMEKCIRLNAFTDGVSLYVSAAGMKPIKDSPAGLYWKSSDTAKHLKLGPSFVTITGRLRDCGRHNAMTAQAAPIASAPGAVPAQPAILGACKTSPIAIFISDVQIAPTAMD
jgi:hypothetical protein